MPASSYIALRRLSDRSDLRRLLVEPGVKGPPMLYSILIYVDENKVAALTPREDDEHIERHLKIQAQLRARGKLGPSVRLEATRTAKYVRTEGEAQVIDGPFAETKEQLLGFYIVDCESQDEALDIAKSLPSLGTIFEVRPVKRIFS
jgi:hypothetical protein